jgi:hypothetical protein
VRNNICLLRLRRNFATVEEVVAREKRGKESRMNDWRVDNAKRTRGAVLRFEKYKRKSEAWDHDHCEGCWAKFMESSGSDVFTEGYVTEDNYRWICSECFRDLQEAMEWKLV